MRWQEGQLVHEAVEEQMTVVQVKQRRDWRKVDHPERFHQKGHLL